MSNTARLQRERRFNAYITTHAEETLLRQSQTAALETPSSKVLEAFNREFRDNNSGILGCSKDIYKDEGSNIQDLAQLHSTERKDRVSTFLVNHMFGWLQVSEMLDILLEDCALRAMIGQQNNRPKSSQSKGVIYLYPPFGSRSRHILCCP